MTSRTHWLTSAIVAVMAALAMSWPAIADDVSQTEVRRLVERGEIRPLTEILAAIRNEFGGRILEVELDRDDGEYIYEIELLTSDGRVLELEYDARTGQRVKLEEDD